MDDGDDGEGDDDDLWDGWGEESDVPVSLGSDMLNDNIMCGEEHSMNDDKEMKKEEIGDKRETNNDFLSKNIENENDIKNNLKILRIQQQQRKKDQKSIKLAKQKLRQQEKIAERNKNVKTEPEELEDSYDEMTSGKEGESGDGEEEGEGGGDDENLFDEGEGEGEKIETSRGKGRGKGRGRVLSISDEKDILQRRLRAQAVLNNIIRDYTTSTSTSLSTHPLPLPHPSTLPLPHPSVLPLSHPTALPLSHPLPPCALKSEISSLIQNENYDKNENKKNKNTITITADDLQCDPRLHDLLGTLAASQQCCSKLWTPKKTGENAYTKVSVST